MVGSSKLERVKRIFTLIPASVLTKWIISVIVISLFFSIFSGTWSGPLNKAFGVVNIVRWLLATGLPLLIGASMVLCTKSSRTHLLDKSICENKQYSSLFLSFTIISLVYMTVSVLVSFTATGFNNFLRYGEFELAFFQYIPQVLGSTLIVTILFVPVAMMIVTAVDRMNLGMLVGTAIFLSLTVATGFPGFPVNRPEIAFFGPSNLVTALFFVLIGGFGQYSVISYIGLSATPSDVVPALVLYGIVFVFGYMVSKRFFISNYKIWQIHSKDWLDDAESDTTSKQHIDSSKIVLAQKQRQRNAAAMAVIVILLVPLTSSLYVTTQLDEWRVVVYESPPGGELVEIGTWLYGSFSGMDPDPYVSLMVGVEGEILEGGGGTSGISYNFKRRQMTLTELSQLNETEMEDEFGGGIAGNTGATTTFGGGGTGPIYEGEYVWILRFLDVAGQTEGMIKITLRVVIFARSR